MQLINKFSEDVFLNLLASIVSTGVAQLVLYPQLALHLSDGEYGEMLMIMGIINVITLSLGNNLCNARIIENEKYENGGYKGDFQILVTICSIIAIVTILLFNISFQWPLGRLIGILSSTVVSILLAYYLVTYRININFRQNLFANIAIAIATIICAFFIISICDWPWVFVIPSLVGLVYIALSSNIFKEPFIKTPLFKSTSSTVSLLVISGFVANITMYLDRFILYPFLGGESVSYYTIASFFPKSLSLVLLPITAVLLSYVSSNKIIFDTKRFVVINLGLLVISTLFFIISITIGKIITQWLYPSLYTLSEPYIYVASIGCIIGIAGSFNGVVVLAKAPSYWQMVLSCVRLVLYLILSTMLVKSYGLFGLCYGVIITNIICFLINYLVGNFYLKKNV